MKIASHIFKRIEFFMHFSSLKRSNVYCYYFENLFYFRRSKLRCRKNVAVKHSMDQDHQLPGGSTSISRNMMIDIKYLGELVFGILDENNDKLIFLER